MVLEVDAMAKVGVKKIAKKQVAFEGLHQVELCAAAQPVEEITE
jgi:hypothetical protein